MCAIRSILAVRHKTIQRTLIKTSKEIEENKTTLSTIYRTPLVHQHVHRITIIKTAGVFFLYTIPIFVNV